MDHFCEYQPEFRVIKRKYDSTNTFAIEATSVCVPGRFICKKIKPKTPSDEFVSIRTNFDDELILGYEIMEEGDVYMERPRHVTGRTLFPGSPGAKKKIICTYE